MNPATLQAAHRAAARAIAAILNDPAIYEGVPEENVEAVCELLTDWYSRHDDESAAVTPRKPW